MLAFIKRITGLLDRIPESIAYWIVGLVGALLSALVDMLPMLHLNPFVAAPIGATILQAIFYWTPITEKFGIKSRAKVEAATVVTLPSESTEQA
jgi:hypothetical protein